MNTHTHTKLQIKNTKSFTQVHKQIFKLNSVLCYLSLGLCIIKCASFANHPVELASNHKCDVNFTSTCWNHQQNIEICSILLLLFFICTCGFSPHLLPLLHSYCDNENQDSTTCSCNSYSSVLINFDNILHMHNYC